MAKSKKQELIPTTAKRKKGLVADEVDLIGEDGWVVVKKQKVTILIPPSPGSNQVTVPNPTETQQQPKLTTPIATQSKSKSRTPPPMHYSGEREKSKSLTPETANLNATLIHPQSNSMLPQLSLPEHKIGSQNLHVDNCKARVITGTFKSPKVIKRVAISIDRSRLLLNRRLRAVILEKKLKRAGGLSNWLVSVGLGRFIKIFQFKHVNKFHLASLTMGKLKDMGAYAVGPRRKLLHALDCLCQPYCFEQS